MIKKFASIFLALSFILVAGCSQKEIETNSTANNRTSTVTGSITVNLETPKETVKKGEYVQIDSEINTGEETVNSLQLVLDYDPELLEFDSVSTSISAFTIWMNKKGENGEVTLSAGEPSPGVKGDRQKVAIIVFKAKKDGIANISLNVKNSKIFTNEEINRLKSEGHSNVKINIEPSIDTNEQIKQ